MSSRVALAIVLALITGCTSTAATTVDGKIGGHGLAAKSAVFVTKQVTTLGLTGTADFVMISDTPALCTELQNNIPIRNSAMLTMMMVKAVSETSFDAPTVGVYPIALAVAVPPFQVSTAIFDATDASCASVYTEVQEATGGNVELTALGANAGEKTTGKIDLLFGGERLVGEFEATFCEVGTGGAAADCQ